MAGSQFGRKIPNLLALLEVCQDEVHNYPQLRNEADGSAVLAVAALSDAASRIGLVKEVI